MKRLQPYILLFVILILLALVVLRRGEAPQEVRRTRLQLGTVVEITAFGPVESTEAAIAAAFDEIDRIERLMSPRQTGSDVSRLNRSELSAPISPETVEVIQAGLHFNRISGGVFDVTLGAVIQLWGFESEHPAIPSPDELERALLETGDGALLLQDGAVRKRSPAVTIDLGGIAKGYAVDRAVAVLRERGIGAAAVNAGGDIRLLGSRPDRSWRIALQHPREQGALLGTIDLADSAVVTSGDYERFFEQDGQRYHHILDPATGFPGRLCQSVTVVAKTAMAADALATAAFILGPAKGLELLDREGANGIMVDAAGKIFVSPGLEGKIAWR